MKFQPLSNVFVFFLFFVVLNALFFLNTNTAFLLQAELPILQSLGFGESSLLTNLLGTTWEIVGEDRFYWRMIPIISVGLSLLFSYRIGSKLFGKDSMNWALVILGCSAFMIFYLRFFSTDALYFAFHLPFSLLLIRFLKTKQNKTLAVLAPLFAALLFFDWFRTIGFVLFFLVGYFVLQPGSSKAKRLAYVALILVALVFNHLFIGVSQYNSLFIFQGMNLNVLGFTAVLVIGTLPYIGFLLAGIVSLRKQVAMKDEFSILMAALLIASVLTFSWLAVFVLALLIAKHSIAFGSERYRYNKLVKTGFILHLSLILCIGIVALIWLFLEYRGPGFRSGMAICAAYWILSFATVIGVYGANAKYYLRAPVLAAPLALLFFWILGFQLHPGFFGPEKPRFSLEMSDAETLHLYAGNSLLRKASKYYEANGSYTKVALYNSNVSAQDIEYPAILDMEVYEKVQANLPEGIKLTRRKMFTGISVKDYFILQEK